MAGASAKTEESEPQEQRAGRPRKHDQVHAADGAFLPAILLAVAALPVFLPLPRASRLDPLVAR